MSRPTIYVAGPLTTGSWTHNTREAFEHARELVRMGWEPYVPHQSLLWDMVHPQDYEWWMARCLAWVEACSAFYRFGGESSGADREQAHAGQLGKPQAYSLDEARALIAKLGAVNP